MNFSLHPDISSAHHYIGNERAPLLVIDNFVKEAEALAEFASTLRFTPMGRAFPGVRALAPAAYREFFLHQAQPYLTEYFNLGKAQLKFTMCHYSLITTPPNQLAMIQRIPHFDSMESSGLASVHYLFKGNLGGTAFYRHRKTGFEYIDETRRSPYLESLSSENDGPNMPSAGYINGDTALYEQIAKHDGIFNRILIYRRNSLHSGSIEGNFIPDQNPATGRLSINSFIDVV